jgi:DNA-directed RNA polymerase specialized sigma24 family protein
MITESSETGSSGRTPAQFTTTHWSVVLAAVGGESPQADAAMDRLCRTYWYPLYVYVRSSGRTPADAEDLTQEFFAKVISKHYLLAVHRERGKFRWFLLSAMKRFLLNVREKDTAAKRGGGAIHVPFDGEKAEERYRLEVSDLETPDRLFDRAWAIKLIETAHQRLEDEYAQGNKQELFKQLMVFVAGDKTGLTYSEAGAYLGMSEGAVKVAVHRLRRRYRELLREEVAQTVHTASDLNEELRCLQAAFYMTM